METIKEKIFEQFKKASADKKELYLKKGNLFTGVYLRIFLDSIKTTELYQLYLQEVKKPSKDSFKKWGKEQLKDLITEGKIIMQHTGGSFMYMLKEDYDELLKTVNKSSQ